MHVVVVVASSASCPSNAACLFGRERRSIVLVEELDQEGASAHRKQKLKKHDARGVHRFAGSGNHGRDDARLRASEMGSTGGRRGQEGCPWPELEDVRDAPRKI